MASILALGFVVGMQHALEADHLAAIAALASQVHGARRTFRLGAAWGIGHSLPLLLLGGVMLAAGLAVPEALERWLDAAVGVMLIVLGTGVLRRFARRRIHLHVHRHHEGQTHLHAHAHEGEPRRDPRLHEHRSHEHRSQEHRLHEHHHGKALTLRAGLAGIVHGLAGSGALVLLALQGIHSAALGMVYIALFALGSLAGMALLTATLSLPLQFTALRLTRVHAAIQGTAGLGAVALGANILHSAL
jgi:hypothetical protein